MAITTIYNIDKEATIVKFTGFKGTNHATAEDYHSGTVKALSGSVEITTKKGISAITGGELVVDMNTINNENGIEKLNQHLKSIDFFDVNQFASASFLFGAFENGVLKGKLNIMGKEYPMESNVTISENKNRVEIKVDEFLVDFSNSGMGYLNWSNYSEEEADKINSNILFSALIVGYK